MANLQNLQAQGRIKSFNLIIVNALVDKIIDHEVQYLGEYADAFRMGYVDAWNLSSSLSFFIGTFSDGRPVVTKDIVGGTALCLCPDFTDSEVYEKAFQRSYCSAVHDLVRYRDLLVGDKDFLSSLRRGYATLVGIELSVLAEAARALILDQEQPGAAK